VQPALAVGEALVARGHERETILYVGSRRGMEARLVPEAGFEVILLPGRGIQRRLTLENLGAAGGLCVACWRALGILLRRRPRVVVTVGGYAGLPCAVAAIVLRTPLVVVSCDAVAGASNRAVARFARRCAVAFGGTDLPRQVVTGAPLRNAVRGTDRSVEGRESARAALGIPKNRFLLAVEGGSLGARRINEATLRLAGSWASRSDVTIYHVAGDRNLAVVGHEAVGLGLGPKDAPDGGLDYRLVGYERQMPALLAACDFAVCRAGALTVAELAAIGTPSALVPLPGAPNDHQTRNAEALTRVGAAILVSDDECSGDRLAEIVDSMREDPESLSSMSVAALSVGHKDASDEVAALIESVIEEVA
jgi:UDP-N-acetylglucosamine--N-acetylmuramyl-(pentapeptide) pyrophosphoryl-undecaprenol N-acetylglucosamine transferase